MIKKLSLSLLTLICLLLIGSALFADDAGRPRINVSEEYWDYGFVPFDYDMVHIIRVENTGEADLIISSISSSCDCTDAVIDDTLIAPGESALLRLDFRTTNYYGQSLRHSVIYSNDPDRPALKIEYNSNIGVLPGYFGTRPIALFILPGQKPGEVALFNQTDEEVAFTLEPEIDSTFTLDRTTGEIPPGKETTVKVSPREDLGRGTYYSSFRVTFKAKKDVVLTFPVKIVRY